MESIIDFLIASFEGLGLYSTIKGLGDHLAGFDMQGTWNGPNVYLNVCLTMFVTCALFVFNYYYGLFNRVKFSVIWYWISNLAICVLIVGGIAYGYAARDLPAGMHSNQIHFSDTDCIGFGSTAAIYSALLFVIFSLIFKWGSRNQSKIPF